MNKPFDKEGANMPEDLCANGLSKPSTPAQAPIPNLAMEYVDRRVNILKQHIDYQLEEIEKMLIRTKLQMHEARILMELFDKFGGNNHV